MHRSAHGAHDPETGYPLRTDTILWLASLFKVIGAAALLTLVEEGRVALDDPVERWLPELAGRRNLVLQSAGTRCAHHRSRCRENDGCDLRQEIP